MTGAWGAGPLEPDAAPSEESLLREARVGEPAAVASLYAAHVASARRLAAILAGPEAAEELVAEAFARVIAQLRAGRGPTTNFRAYLHTTIRNLHRDTFRGAREVPASDRPWLLDESESPIDDLVEGLDANGATAALASLPGTWQQVLWHLEVEGRKPAEVADLLATTPAVVSSLVYRAREGLRRAYLDQYAGPPPADPHCGWTRSRLSQYVRKHLSNRAATRLADHLAGCSQCAAAHNDMARLNTQLAAYVFPVVLVGGMAALDRASEAGGGAALAGGPDQLVSELAARADGMPVQDAVSAAVGSGSGRLGARSRRASVSAAVAAVAMVAIAATAFAVTRDGGEPSTTADNGIAAESDDGAPADVPTPTEQPTLLEVSPSTLAAPTPSAAVVPTDDAVLPTPTIPGVSPPTAPGPTAPGPTAPDPTAPDPTRPDPSTPDPTAPSPTSPAETQPFEVAPVAPSATPITRCGTYGSLQIQKTQGIRYSLVVGDGRQGPWVVAARAAPGYAIKKGSPTRYDGDLGRFETCQVPLAIREATTVATGDSPNGPWRVTVTSTAPDHERRTLSVSYWFETSVEIVRKEGDGWTCRGPGGADVGPGTRFEPRARISCVFGNRATHPSPISLVVRTFTDSGAAIAPSGTAALSADGDVVDVEDFDSVDR